MADGARLAMPEGAERAGSVNANEVVLVFSPWGSLEQPSLAFGLIKAILARTGLGADVEYLNLRFAERLGVDLYRSLKDRDVMVSEWIFAEAAFGKFRPRSDFLSYIRSLGYSAEEIAEWAEVQAAAAPFVDECVAKIDFRRYKVAGFTTSMIQSVSALAIAKRAKEINPKLKVVFGGANCEGEMGAAMIENFPFIDVVVRRDCDAFVAELFQRLCDDHPLDGLPVCVRNGDAVHVSSMPPVFKNLDLNPIPDYDDYFEQLAMTPFAEQIRVNLVFEGSRGCWYGQKVPCTFCAVTGSSMEYRAKSPERLVDELSYLAERHGVTWFGAADNILDFRSQQELCTRIAERIPNARIFFDVKANLTRAQIKSFKRAGIDEVQPGIESLSTRLLKLMKKGTTAIRNVHVLRMFAEIGIWPMWNYLYGFPGETLADYDAIIAWSAPALFHLPAPYVGFGLSMMRFSQYFDHPEKYGVTIRGPLPHYEYIYNLAPDQISRIAYYFRFAHADGYDPEVVGRLVGRFTAQWQQAYYVGRAELVARLTGREVRISDTRFGERIAHRLTGAEARLYRLMECPQRVDQLAASLRAEMPGAYLQIGGEAGIADRVERWVEARLAFREGQLFVAIAVPERPDDFWSIVDAGAPTRTENTLRPKPSILHWKVDHLHV
ncbi:RiPP maturation radical SAM C-methyltransferase [Bradyrhizobium sp. HKCCYLRH3061]|uniref:RiPP maturation radical SAM C-methyltransferase n=1 Tax=Bradyrhizobium sp. HKCCYLRH3061 TaxID=3420734 RepID=UPI003EC02C33